MKDVKYQKNFKRKVWKIEEKVVINKVYLKDLINNILLKEKVDFGEFNY